MTDDDSGDAKASASDLARTLSADMHLEVSEASLDAVAQAFEQDVVARSHKAKDDEERLTRVELQTQVLSEAVIAITKIEKTLAPAVRAVKHEMHVPGATDQKHGRS